jgi:ParB family transcriptional regulator, chromosome partitioning protein
MQAGKKTSGLGRGLSALLGDLAPGRPDEPQAEPGSVPAPLRLAIERIYPSPTQPRRHFDETALHELEESIREKGILLPLLVRPSRNQPGLYEIIAGERRWRAAQRVPLHEVPVIVRDLEDAEVFELALIENIQREDLNAIEEALGYQRLIADFHYSQERLAHLVGKSRSHVANMLRLLDLPPLVRTMVAEGALTMGHARALITSPDAERLAREAVDHGLSVRQVEQLVKSPAGAGKKSGPGRPKSRDADTVALERDVSAALGMPVRIAFAGQKGSVTVAYQSLDQLDDLCQRLCSSPQRNSFRAFPIEGEAL